MKRDTLIQFLKDTDSVKTGALSTQAKSQIKARLMSTIQNVPVVHAEPAAKMWTFFYTKFALVAVCILILLTGTAYASSSAIPGDVLYPVKRAVEDTRVILASTSETKAQLQVEFTEERLQELEKIEQKAPLKPMAPQIKPAAQTPLATGTALTLLEPEPEHEETVAENSARKEVSKALRTLEKTQKDLQQQGKDSIANDLAKTIRILNGRISKKNRENSEAKTINENTDQRTRKELQTDTNNDDPSPGGNRSGSSKRRGSGN